MPDPTRRGRELSVVKIAVRSAHPLWWALEKSLTCRRHSVFEHGKAHRSDYFGREISDGSGHAAQTSGVLFVVVGNPFASYRGYFC